MTQLQNSQTLEKKTQEKLLPLEVSVQIFLLIRHVMAQSAYSPGSPSLSHPGKSAVLGGGVWWWGFFSRMDLGGEHPEHTA